MKYSCVGVQNFTTKDGKVCQIGHFVADFDQSRQGVEGKEAFNCFVDPAFTLVPGLLYHISWYEVRTHRIAEIEEA